jgi:hypothetical protein
MEQISNIDSASYNQSNVGRSPDKNQALMDLSTLDDDMSALEKAIEDGSTKEIDAAKLKIAGDITTLQTLLKTVKDFSPLELQMVNGDIGQIQDMTMIPDQGLLNPADKDQNLIACGIVQGSIRFTMSYLELNVT